MRSFPTSGIRLRGEVELRLLSRTWYRVVKIEGGRKLWEAATIAYSHRLETPGSEEIISYHWHPGQGAGVPHPHMHLGAGIGANLGILDKTHIPTGVISLEDLLHFTIRELGAEPQREDWPGILAH